MTQATTEVMTPAPKVITVPRRWAAITAAALALLVAGLLAALIIEVGQSDGGQGQLPAGAMELRSSGELPEGLPDPESGGMPYGAPPQGFEGQSGSGTSG